MEAVYFGGRTYAAAAVHMSIPIGTLKTRISDGLAVLRRILPA
ncbi:hypothetical protein [Anatilimnocola aggregata]